MVSVHVYGQVDYLNAQTRDDHLENAIESFMRFGKLEALNLLKRHFLIFGAFHVLQLALNSSEDSSGQSFNQNLNHSCAVDVKRDGYQVVADLIDEAFQSICVGDFHDSLTQVVAKLVNHDIRSYW